MEGPSLLLAAEQLAPFVGKVIKGVSGNSKAGIDRLFKKKILAIFAHGKQLIFQFDSFALRIHFMLYGSFKATVNGVEVTGDYPAKNKPVRLRLDLSNGHIDMYNCSVKFIESDNVYDSFDFSIDTLSEEWDPAKAFKEVKKRPNEQISDVLLDQNLFAGVGNIIRNEVLFLAKTLPTYRVEELSDRKLKEIIKHTREYVFHFYEWRKKFELRKHYQVYRQSVCKKCGGKVTRKKSGLRNRVSFICSRCEI